MTLMDAKVYDEAAARRRKMRILAIVVTLLVLGFLAYQFRYWPEERLVDKFFTALQKQDYEIAYGLYVADPNWKQHPQQQSLYPYNEFYRDWGPRGESQEGNKKPTPSNKGNVPSHEILSKVFRAIL